MSFGMMTMKPTKTHSMKIEQLRGKIENNDFIEKYHFRNMYEGGFYPFDSLEEHWAYWSRYIYINRYMDAPEPVCENLYELVKDKEYFVLTTNVDHCFQKAGFAKERLFYTQGDYGLFQCQTPIMEKVYKLELTKKPAIFIIKLIE